MTRSFKAYILIWAICLALFNVIVFVVPIERSHSFWIGYAFITLAFLGQLGCTYMAFKAESIKKLFYNIPLITVSYTGLIIMMVAGAICMAISDLPNWFGVIVCLLVLGFTAIAVISDGMSAHIVGSVEEKVAAQTGFIKSLTVDAETLMHRVNAPMLKKQCKKVYEALRYSDPISDDALSAVEKQIKAEFDVFTDAVSLDELETAESAAKEVVSLIAERNNKCRILK